VGIESQRCFLGEEKQNDSDPEVYKTITAKRLWKRPVALLFISKYFHQKSKTTVIYSLNFILDSL
jgi:hypothetical protein